MRNLPVPIGDSLSMDWAVAATIGVLAIVTIIALARGQSSQ
jgi:energy-converting hydrogenase Eha subunit B